MPRQPLSADTSGEIERLLSDQWRQMSAAHKAVVVTGLTQAAYELALAGVGWALPGRIVARRFLRPIVMLGSDLARRSYPDRALLDLP